MPGPLGIGGGGGGSGGTVTTPVFPFIDRAVAQTSDTGSITFATPGSSAIGDTAAAGTATTVSRSDHVHGREAAGTPGASAVGDTASAGSATTVARSDHRHSREAFGTPVNLDASLTSLSAGSLTAVARADHVHTVSNVPVLIANARMTTATASYTFSNIPSTFRHLCISVVGRSTWTGGNPDYVLVQFNGDSGANYYSSTSVGQTSCFIGVMNSATAGTPTMPSSDNIIIPNYSQTTWNKLAYTMEGWYNNSTTGTPNLSLWFNCTFWNSSAIITSVKVFCNAGNMATNTDLRLFGVP